MLKRAEPPICVGLYARWGSGKTFMISLLKRGFDPDVREDPHTRRLLQFFEEGYGEPEAAAEPETVCSLINGLLLTILSLFVPYGVTTFASIICDAFDVRGALCAVWVWCFRLKRSRFGCRPFAKTSPQRYEEIAQSGTDNTKQPDDDPAKKSNDNRVCLMGLRLCNLLGAPLRIFLGRFGKTPKVLDSPAEKPVKPDTEFVFVDFNAWECAACVSSL